ncbi:SURF1 family protein [Paracoccaceae bacterium GXU_MW_L88]
MTHPDEDTPRRRPLLQLAAVLVLGVAMLAGFLSLGVWQVQRLAWKRDLIARVDARVEAPAVNWQEITGLPPDEQEYCHVTATGVFDHSKEAFVQAVTELDAGFWVLTPLQTADGQTILINRGFVPPERVDPATRAEGQIDGEVTVTGLARLTEPEGAFLRSNDPENDRWYSRDIDALAAARDLGAVANIFIDADDTANPGGYPVGGLTVIQFRNAHLVYALTWFGLAIMVAVGLSILIRHERRLRG